MTALEYRTQARIVADLLVAARDLDQGDGVGVTALLRRCNLSYSRTKPLLFTLIGSGLLSETVLEESRRYAISSEGRSFLATWSRFSDFAQSYGFKS